MAAFCVLIGSPCSCMVRAGYTRHLLFLFALLLGWCVSFICYRNSFGDSVTPVYKMTLEHPAQNRMCPANPSPQGSGTPRKGRQKGCQSQRGCRTPRKQGLLTQQGLRICDCRDCGSTHRACTGLYHWGSRAERSG